MTNFKAETSGVSYPLDLLIKKYGMIEFIRDYYADKNGYLHMLRTEDNFYIAEDFTYQPWLSVMGDIPDGLTDEMLFDMLSKYIHNDKYIAVYTCNERIANLLKSFKELTYHEDFKNAILQKASDFDSTDIRLAEVRDLDFIESTYSRSGRNQLYNRIKAKQLWVCESDNIIKGYIGIHKDCSLGFEYVDPSFRRQHIATNLQNFVADYMIKNNMLPYVMISANNAAGKELQDKFGSVFAQNLFYFFAKGAYELE